MTGDEHIAAARQRLTDLEGLSLRTAQAERNILAAATARLDAVNADLNRLRPRALTDEDAGEEYTALVSERGQLQTIIAQAQLNDQP